MLEHDVYTRASVVTFELASDTCCGVWSTVTGGRGLSLDTNQQSKQMTKRYI